MPLIIEMGWTEEQLYANSDIFIEELSRALKRKYDNDRRTKSSN